ncbi:Sec-independent protein translocase subunit TatA/TatB [Parabacteroides timonensis]|uniref:Sec-independent protein translocase subunit TatA/TatB n=1 Tax=Parabacteroides timonensis TaxID=1871013 RepID=UPI00094E00F1|nr:twin-arginine translocase TatA/TatE family subunit [Parabacteroides timonensis]
MTPLFIGGIGMQEVLLIALVVLLFFGGKKIPELMKGLGKGVRSFKDGMHNIESDIELTDKENATIETKEKQ